MTVGNECYLCKNLMNEQIKNLNQAILAAMDTYAQKTCFKVKRGEHYHNISYQRFQTLTLCMVKFLRSQGISNGERVVIASDNCLEWMVIYMATLLSGGMVVPLRPSLAFDTLRFTLQDSGACLVVLNNEQLLQAILDSVKADPNRCPDLQTILVMDEVAESYPGPIPIRTILAETESLTAEEREAIRFYAVSTAPETLISIHYTGGEAGRLRGAVFDHARALKTMQHMAEWLPLDEDDLAFTILSWGYPPSLQAALHYFLSGVANVLSDARGTAIAEDMQQTGPTVTLNMPHFFEDLYDIIMDNVARMPETSQEMFEWAVAKGREFWAAGPTASKKLREAYARADLTFFSQFKGGIGGRMRRLYSTGAPLPQNLAEFFEAIGLPVLNVYSVTEAGGFPAVSRPEARRLGSCGQISPGFDIRIADDGELLVRGETVMCEYWGWPIEMQPMLDIGGWLHTGNLARFGQDDYLYLTGRKQPVMVLSMGHKIMPTPIEEALMASPFIAQATVFGEGRPYVSALIVPNLEALATHFQEEEEVKEEATPSTAPSSTTTRWFWRQETDDSKLMTTTAHPTVKALLDKVVGEANRPLKAWAQIREYSLIEQAASKTADELAQLVKLGRHVVAERYVREIDTMYPLMPHQKDKEVTQFQVTPERLQELLEKESILDAWLADAGIQFLFDLARTKHIDAPSMVHICDAAATIAQMESEEKPLSTALIVGDPGRISRFLPPSQIQLLRHDHIRRMRKILITLAKMVDGLVLGYLVDKHGYVRGIHKLNVALDEQAVSFLLGPQFRHHAIISRQCDALVFFVPTGGRQVRVFANGHLVGRYSNGDWSPDNMHHVDKVLTALTQQKNYDLNLVRRVLRCAFQMSEENLGAIFLVGNVDAILEYADAPETSHFAMIVSTGVEHLSDRELINFAKQDGATVIDVQGKFRGCMVLLRPRADTQAEIGPGKGARHSSAAKMSAEAHCLAITVSQDGPITIYDSGRRVLSL